MPHSKKIKEGTSHVMAAYVEWFEERGVHVRPIPFDTKPTDALFCQLHGLLVPGGETDVVMRNKTFMRTLRRWMELALSSDVYFPVWGTCFGMEALLAVLGGLRTFRKFPAHGRTPITFTQEGMTRARMFRRMSRTALYHLEHSPSTVQNHEFGISRAEIESHPHLHRFFSIVATAIDENQQEYVAAIEGRLFPVYSVMWHPERGTRKDSATYERETASALADFFIRELRKCSHRPTTIPPLLRFVKEEQSCIQYPELCNESCYFF